MAGHVSTSLIYSGTELPVGESVCIHMWISANYGEFTSGNTVDIWFDSLVGEYGMPVKLV